jgi:hypothetical protein
LRRVLGSSLAGVVLAFVIFSCANQNDYRERGADSSGLGNSTRPATKASLDCRHALTFDVGTGSVAGFKLDAPDSAVEASLPAGSFKRNVHIHDADTAVAFTITLCGHVLELGGNGIFTSDSAFVTTDGLRVGLPIGRFEQVWGKGQLMSSEAGWRMYYFQKVSINAGIDACISFPRPHAPPTIRPDCPVESIWISTPRRVSGAKSR